MRTPIALLLLLLVAAACGDLSVHVDGDEAAGGAGGVASGEGGGGDASGGGKPDAFPWPAQGRPDRPADPSAPTCASLAAEGLLCHDAWCWLLDGEQGQTLHDLHAPHPFTTFAVGVAGTILRHEGGRWHREASGTTAALHAVHGLRGGLPWAAGDGGTVLRRTAAGWEKMPAPGDETLRSLRVRAGGEVWVAGEHAVHRWQAGRWERVIDRGPARLWTDGSGGLWMLLDGGLWQWSDEAFVWRGEAAGPIGGSRDGAPLVADRSRLYRADEDGLHLITEVPGGGSVGIRQIEERADGTIWFVASRFVGPGTETAWLLYEWRGGELTERWSQVHDTYGYVRALELVGEEEEPLLVGAAGLTLRHRGGKMEGAGRGGPHLAAIHPLGPEELVAMHAGRAYHHYGAHWDGRSWSALPFFELHVVQLAGTTADDLWIAGGTGLRHWNGEEAVEHDPQVGSLAALAFARDDAWVVGRGGTAHWNGKVWSPVEAPEVRYLSHLWASGPDDVWAAGETLLHWDGRGWSLPPGIPEGAKPTIRSLAGAGRDDVWAVGLYGILHWDGRRWREVEGPAHPQRIWTAGGDAVFLEAEGGWYRRKGGGWRKLPFAHPPHEVAGPPAAGFAAFGSVLARFCRD